MPWGNRLSGLTAALNHARIGESIGNIQRQLDLVHSSENIADQRVMDWRSAWIARHGEITRQLNEIHQRLAQFGPSAAVGPKLAIVSE